MKMYYLLSLIPAFCYLLFKSKKAMHMLQQNWYNDGNRYIDWIFNNKKKVFLIIDLLFILILLLDGYKAMIVFMIMNILFFYNCDKKYKNEQSKKPLVITARIKRLYATLIIVYVLLVYVTTVLWFNEQGLSFYYFYVGLFICIFM